MIGFHCRLDGRGNLTIGNNVNISSLHDHRIRQPRPGDIEARFRTDHHTRSRLDWHPRPYPAGRGNREGASSPAGSVVTKAWHLLHRCGRPGAGDRGAQARDQIHVVRMPCSLKGLAMSSRAEIVVWPIVQGPSFQEPGDAVCRSFPVRESLCWRTILSHSP